jgi:uncharacterized delta-60 repeat protein
MFYRFSLPFLLLSCVIFGQQGVINTNFGLGEYNYAETTYDKRVATAADYSNDTLYIAGYSSQADVKSNVFSASTKSDFPSRDGFYFANATANKNIIISVGDYGSRANAVKKYNKFAYLAGYSKDKNNKSIALVRVDAANAQLPVASWTFNQDNKVITSFTGDDSGNSIDIKNNKIFVAGKAGNNAVVVRYNMNGYVDKTFTQKGFVFLNIGLPAEITAIKILDDNKILVSGNTTTGSQSDIFVAKLNEDGTSDTTFGSNGVNIFDFYGYNDHSNSMKVLQNGDIILGGSCGKISNSNLDTAIIMLTANGALKTSFNGTGKLSYDEGTQEDIIQNIEYKKYNTNTGIREDIYALGYKKSSAYKNSFVRIFTMNGTALPYQNPLKNLSFYNDDVVAGYFDNTTFDTDGISLVANSYCRDANNYIGFGVQSSFYPISNSCGEATNTAAKGITKIKTRPDGKFYILNGNILARYLSSGLIDTTFGENGYFKDLLVSEFDLLPDHSIIICAFRKLPVTVETYLVRLDENGTVINNFEFKNLKNSSSEHTVKVVYSEPTNKIYAYYPTPYSTEFTTPVLCRYNLDGTIDQTFGNNSAYIPLPPVVDYNTNIQLQKTDISKNKIIIAEPGNTGITFKMYDLSGVADPNFGSNGISEVAFSPEFGGTLVKTILDSNDNIYLIAHQYEGFFTKLKVEKHRSDGTLATDYGVNGVFTYVYSNYRSSSRVDYADSRFQTDNKLLISGKRSTDNGVADNGYLIRISPEGSLDTTFGAQKNGIFCDLADNNPSDYLESITAFDITTDNKIILGGLNKVITAGNTAYYSGKIKKLD